MALGRKTGGRNFQPGQSGNPKGKTPLPPDIKGLKTLFNQEMVEKTFIKYMMMSVGEMAKVGEDKNLPAMDHVIMMIIRKAGLDGDQQRLDFLLNRTIGKVVDKTQNTDYRVNINAQLDQIPKEKLVALLKESEERSYVNMESDE